MAKRKYRWFVEPVGAHTNQCIYDLIKGTEVDELLIDGDEAEDGRGHSVYECSREQLNAIKNSLNGSDMQAHFWVREGNGKYRRWQPEAIRKASRLNRLRKKLKGQAVFPFARGVSSKTA